MMKRFGIPVAIFLVASIIVLISYDVSLTRSPSYEENAVSSAPVDIDQTNFSRIQSEVAFFSSVETRVTGYGGCDRAADHIVEVFGDLGLDVQIHEYYLPVPVDEGSWISVDRGPHARSNLTAYALWPDAGVASANGDFSGKIFYLGQGTLKDMNGLDIQESVVLLDFNSGKNWLDAAELGAKGAIFIEPLFTEKYQALDKGALAPLDFARLYVTSEVGEELKEVAANNGSVTMHVNMKWENKRARNIIGVVEGDYPDDVLIVSAHYDSWSIVPAISPAAEDAIGISTLLELARYFKDNKPRQTLWFVAYSGHWEGGTGAVEFAGDVLLRTTKRTWLQIGVDISSESPTLDCLYLDSVWGSIPTSPSHLRSTPRGQAIFALGESWALRFGWIESLSQQFLDIPLESISNRSHMPHGIEILGDLVTYNLRVGRWYGTQTDFYMLDTEPSLSLSMMAATFRTQYARRVSWSSPLNTTIVWGNVWPQATAIAILVNGFASLDAIPYDYSTASPKTLSVTPQGVAGYVTLSGKTVEFSNRTAWYEPLPNVLVRLYIYDNQASNAWPFSYRYTFSDDRGLFEFRGLIPYLAQKIDAWKLSQTTGEIEYVVDMGFYGMAQGVAGGLRTEVFPLTASISTLVPLFRCEQVSLFGLVDTRTMRSLVVRDHRNPSHNYFDGYSTMTLGTYQALSKSTPIFIGIYAGSDGVADIYVKQGERIVVTFSPNPAQISHPTMILCNSSEGNPEGNGYTISEHTTLCLTSYHAMIDMYRIAKNRYASFSTFQVRITYAEEILEKAAFFLNEANSSYLDRNYEDMYSQSILALQLLHKVYSQSVMPLYDEAAVSVSFFSFLILLFSVLFERLVFQWSSYKRFIGILLLMALFFILYALVHPAFSIMANSFMAIVGVGVLLILATISTIFVTETRDMLETISVNILGEHTFRRGRLSVVMHTLTSSVENMRKRPMLTLMALVSIVFFTAAQTAFTSTSYGYSIVKSPVSSPPPYTGILLKNSYGMPPDTPRGGTLDTPLLKYLQGLAGEDYVLSPRVWMYPQSRDPEYTRTELITADGTKLRLSPSAFLGLSSTELQLIFEGRISGLDSFMGKYQCIIPHDLAALLDMKVGDVLTIKGIDANFSVIGIVDFTEQVKDLDGKPFLPINPSYSEDLLGYGLQTYPETMVPTPLTSSDVIYIPWQTALERGGFISSVTLIPKAEKTPHEMEELASTLASSLSIVTHVGIRSVEESTGYSLRTIFSYVFQGWDIMIVVLMVLVSLSIVNFMLGTFIARKKEIQTFATLGLSPGGVMVVFFTEAITLGFGGTLLGYLGGFALNQLSIEANLLPSSFTFNFISLPVIITMVTLICAVLVASLYPALLAARIVTPSLERRWRAATRPKGDVWEIRLPLKAREFEASGILRYFHEYYTGAGGATAGFRVLDITDVNVANIELELDVILTPVERDITQTAIIKGKEEEGEYPFTLTLVRKTGDPKLWQSRNRPFIDDLRKQSLLWKSLTHEQRSKYITRP